MAGYPFAPLLTPFGLPFAVVTTVAPGSSDFPLTFKECLAPWMIMLGTEVSSNGLF